MLISLHRKQAMPFLTVDAIIGNQACKNGKCLAANAIRDSVSPKSKMDWTEVRSG